KPWRWFASRSRRRGDSAYINSVKTIELDHPVDLRQSLWPRAFVCIAIGAFVPAVLFLSALIVSLEARNEMPMPFVIWGACFLISTTAIKGGTSLAHSLLGSRGRIEQTAKVGKPASFDPESFEIANGHH